MKYATATAFRAALDDRIRDAALRMDVTPMRLRKYIVHDRLLARLSIAAPNRWVVKGGAALDLRFGTRARTTKDLDLGRHDDEASSTTDLTTAQRLDLSDFFVLSIERRDDLEMMLDGSAVRYGVKAELDGRLFAASTLDIGFDTAPVEQPDTLIGLPLLTFAGFEPISVPALPLEFHVAEKVSAYVRIYVGQRPSSRAKDLVDLVIVRSLASIEASRLKLAFNQIFSNPGAPVLPVALPPPPSTWESAYRKLTQEVRLDPDLTTGYRLAAAFLDPVLDGSAPDDAQWDPTRSAWIMPRDESASVS